jgi:hypothetical protein
MDRVTHRFVRFYAPGSFVANDWEQAVETSLNPHDVKWPDNAYAFTLHERVDVFDGPEKFTGAVRQIGPIYYHPDSKVMTEAEIAAKGDPNNRILLANMRCNRWPSVIYSRWGNWPQPYEADKVRVLGAA